MGFIEMGKIADKGLGILALLTALPLRLFSRGRWPLDFFFKHFLITHHFLSHSYISFSLCRCEFHYLKKKCYDSMLRIMKKKIKLIKLILHLHFIKSQLFDT